MHIKNLNLKNFRNYENETFEFGPNLNVLFGKNGQGKTNCVEAVLYLTTGVSPRAKRDKLLIRDGERAAEAKAEIAGKYGSMSLRALIMEDSREIYVNENRIKRISELMGNLYCVFFSPRELKLIQDGPDERRRFLNITISQTNRAYFTALQRYNKVLENRNVLLKRSDLNTLYETLPIWDDQLAAQAGVICAARRDFLNSLAPLASASHAFLTDGAEELIISPEQKYKGDESEIAKRFKGELDATHDRDIRMGFTGSGPHRDDFDIVINGKDARNYASQGQARTAALSLMLSVVEVFKEITGENPVLVLDDVMSELDLPRRKKLVERTDGLQTIITCTHAERVLYGKDATKIRIEGGTVKR